MSLRVTPASLYLRSLHSITSAYARFARAQEVMASGKRISVLSDAPADGARVLDLGGALDRTLSLKDALDSARQAVETQTDVLEQLSSLIASAKQKAQEAANGTLSEADREQLALELDQLLVEAVGFANQETAGRRLFAGSKALTKPFQVTTVGGRITAVHYVGDDLVRFVQLASGERKPVDLSGSDVFLELKRAATVVAGDIGLKGVAGAHDTMIGDSEVVVEHVATTFGDGGLPGGGDSVSGLAPGASSAQDSIVGAHVLSVTLDEATGQPALSLDGGATVPFDGTETDLAVAGPTGATIHVDVTGLAPGFQGDVAIAADGTIAVEGGPAQALAFSADQTLSDGQGRVVHLDTTDVNRTGNSLLVFPGTETVFDALIHLRDELLGDTGSGDAALADRVLARVASLDAAHDGVASALTTLGGRQGTFERLSQTLDFFGLKLQEEKGNLEGADVFEASTELSAAENAYQFALAAAARLQQPSLVNFL